MEDLFPLVIFLVIVGANVFKFLAEKGKAKPSSGKGQPQPRRKSSLESFFEDLTEQMAPTKPTEPVVWPEGRERSGHVHEMEEFEEEQTAEPLPVEVPEPIAAVREMETPPAAQPRRSGFRIEGRKNLKQAMIAHIIFSPPRAYDLSFSDTLQKRG